MSDATLATPRKWNIRTITQSLKPSANTKDLSPAQQKYRQIEFMIFAAIAFIGKSALLIRMPYRSVASNTFYTCLLLLLFYCYYRFRNNLIPPIALVLFLAGAVSVDVFGNYFHLYGKDVGPNIVLWGVQISPQPFDHYSHFAGAGLSLPATMWLLRSGTRKLGHKLPLNLIAFLSVTITFSFAAYYEILELWDEKFFGGRRIWTLQDTSLDLQNDLIGIVVAALICAAVYKATDRRAAELQHNQPTG
ncbi:MAG TPA: hypothetical protein VFC63_14045 [Blastocatellia bacterium]|nr:hypothetical protein [Blastocatellia bacterium]